MKNKETKENSQRRLQLSSVQSLSHVWFSVSPFTAVHKVSQSITNSQILLELMCIESVRPSNHLILFHSFFHLQSLPARGSFPMSQFFASCGLSIAVSGSASVFPMNIQDWLLLRLTALTSLHSKGFSRVFSNTTVQKHQFNDAQLSL